MCEEVYLYVGTENCGTLTDYLEGCPWVQSNNDATSCSLLVDEDTT